MCKSWSDLIECDDSTDSDDEKIPPKVNDFGNEVSNPLSILRIILPQNDSPKNFISPTLAVENILNVRWKSGWKYLTEWEDLHFDSRHVETPQNIRAQHTHQPSVPKILRKENTIPPDQSG